jgi:diketogulonate reductase-like aldo/keto reductase
VPLPGGARMPLIGFGTYKVDSVDAVRNALEAGYRHLDCAPVYGNEALVGEAIQPWLKEHGRESLFLTSKVWNDAHRPQLLRESVQKTLSDLGVQRLDLLLMHWPDAWVPGSDKQRDDSVTLEETWQAMEQLVDEGAAKTIGVSNFSERQLSRLCGAARIKPAVNQVELHPLLSQRRLVGACARKGITCEAYGPLGHSKTDLLAHPEVTAVAKEVDRSPAQVLLRWNVQRGVAVLPKASSQSHMLDNIQGLWEWQLTYEQKARLDALDQGKRFVNPEWHDFED